LVEFGTDSDSGYHDFRDGHHVVLDILAPKTDAAAYAPPGAARPQVTKMAGASAAQVKAIGDAAARLAGKKIADAKPAEAKRPDARKSGEGKPDAKAADAKDATPDATAAATPPAAPSATGQLTKTGASLGFRGAGAAAVFVRGTTAWVVLENAPAPDAAGLQKALNGFATTVEVSTNPGLAVLRIGLKTPAKIAAHAEGQALRVTIGGDVASDAIAIGFARNQADPKRTSLTTTLPRADKTFQIIDPASGDTLSVVPSAAG
jgi:hypothetical protein